MATLAVPSEFIDLELTFGVKYERSQIVFMNGCCNWNEQMLQYCSSMLDNKLLVLFFSSALCVECLLFPLMPHPSPSLLPDSVLCAMAVLSD